MAIKLLITDFDGTLVDTFEANYLAYKDAFAEVGLDLTKEAYQGCFGFRFDKFMETMGINDDKIKSRIKELKSRYYPRHFGRFQVNEPLFKFIKAFHRAGGYTAIASTAREQNLKNALRHIGANDTFDYILAGEMVEKGKPDPEIYLKILSHFGLPANDALVFEDSQVGFEAAEQVGLSYIAINAKFYNNGN